MFINREQVVTNTLVITGSELRRRALLRRDVKESEDRLRSEPGIRTRSGFLSGMLSALDGVPEAPVWLRFLSMRDALGLGPGDDGPPSCFSRTARPTLLVRRLLRIRFVFGMGRVSPETLREAVQDVETTTEVQRVLPDLLASYAAILESETVRDRPMLLEDLLERARNVDHLPAPFQTVNRLELLDVGHLHELEFRVFQALLQNVEHADVRFDYNPEREEAFAWVLPTLKKFERSGLTLNQVKPSLRGTPGQGTSALETLRNQIFRDPEELRTMDRIPGDDSIQFLEASQPTREVRIVARRIRDLLEDGVPPAEIAVVRRSDGSTLRELVRELTEQNVPVFHRDTGVSTGHPATKAYLQPVEAAVEGLGRSDVMEVIRNRLLGGPADLPADRLEELFREAGITGGAPTEWARRLDNVEEALTRRVDAYETARDETGFFPGDRDREETLQSVLEGRRSGIETLLSTLQACGEVETLGELLETFLDVEREFELRDRLLRSGAETPEDAAGYRSVSDFREFVHELYTGLDATSRNHRTREPEEALQLFRSIRDQHMRRTGRWAGAPDGVRVLEPADLVGMSFEHVFMVSVNDGEWPRPVVEDPFLGDELIHQIRDVKERTVLPSVSRKRDRELYLFYQALSAAESSLVVSWSSTDGQGGDSRPSPYLEDVRERLRAPDDADTSSREPPVYSDRDRFRERVDRLMTPGVEGGGRATEPADRSTGSDSRLLRERLQHALERIDLESQRQRFFTEAEPERRRERSGPWSGVVTDRNRLERLLENTPYGSEHRWTVTGLERYAQCPYAFFSERILDLQERELPGVDLNPRREGLLLHEILRRLYADGETGRGDEPVQDVDEVCERVYRDWVYYGFQGEDAFWTVTRERLKIRVERVVKYLERTRADGVEIFTELSFGEGRRLRGVLEDTEDDLRIEGRIDRLEVGEGGTGAVLDYKNARRSRAYRRLLKKDEFGERSFQIPVYLLAAAGAQSSPIDAVSDWEAGFITIQEDRGEPMLSVRLPEDEGEREAWLRDVRDRIHEGASRIAGEVKNGRFDVTPDPCRSGCPYRQMCRYEDLAPDRE